MKTHVTNAAPPRLAPCDPRATRDSGEFPQHATGRPTPYSRFSAILQCSARWVPWFAALVGALILLRLAHFGGHLDGPHYWRDCDTAHYAMDFYAHGIRLLHPRVCWLGGHGTHVLEFPLPEALMALAYHVLGPKIAVARGVTLLFFLGSACCLHRIVLRLRGSRAARLTTLFYLAAPLSIGYSRAVHVDFSAVFFGHAMLYCLLRGCEDGKAAWMLLGSSLGTLGFLVKAPYVFYLFLPLGFHAWRVGKVRALLKWSPLLACPAVAFLWWRWHADSVNAASPDWRVIPGYWPFVMNGWGYFGPLAMRLHPTHWMAIARRAVLLVTGDLGLCFFLAGLLARPAVATGVGFFRVWLAGSGAYVAIFFNLNWIHDYYQIPLLAPCAFFLAQGLEVLFLDRAPRCSERLRLAFAATILLLLATSVRTAERVYFKVDWPTVRAGRAIGESTPENALVIVAHARKSAWFGDPRVLYHARRNGWPVILADLSAPLVETLRDHGATHLAILTDAPLPPRAGELLERRPAQEFDLGQGWRLLLSRAHGEAPGGPQLRSR